jgi:hypothetical protein
VARPLLTRVVTEKLQTMNAMKTKTQWIGLMCAVAVTLAVTGCDRTISHEESSKVSRDGTVTTKEKTETVNPDGTITKTEEIKKTTTP